MGLPPLLQLPLISLDVHLVQRGQATFLTSNLLRCACNPEWGKAYLPLICIDPEPGQAHLPDLLLGVGGEQILIRARLPHGFQAPIKLASFKRSRTSCVGSGPPGSTMPPFRFIQTTGIPSSLAGTTS